MFTFSQYYVIFHGNLTFNSSYSLFVLSVLSTEDVCVNVAVRCANFESLSLSEGHFGRIILLL